MLFLYLLLSLAISCKFAAGIDISSAMIYREENATRDGKTVLLGGLFRIHESSDVQSEVCGFLLRPAVQLVESMVLAVREINEDPTLLPNITLTFDIRDTCSSVNFALQQSVNYIQGIDGICSDQTVLGASGVVGASITRITEPLANFFGIFQIPQISYGATASFLSESRFDYFFRTIPPDFYQARALADLVAHFDWTYIIALHSNDLYGRDGIAEFQDELELLNTNTTRRCVAITIALNDVPPNYEEAVDMMNQEWVSNASVALLFGHTENAVGILSVLRNRINADPNFPLQNITWIGSDSWGDSLPAEYHSMARGMLGVVPQFNIIRKFDDHFTSLNPRNNPNNPWFVEFWEEIFNCSLGLSPNPKECDLDNQKISENTTGYSQFSLVPLVFDAVYALAHSIQDLIDDNCPNRSLCPAVTEGGGISGEMLRDYLLNVSFKSPSQENIMFDENGDVLGAYTILNLQSVPGSDLHFFEPVGTWDIFSNLSITGNIEWVSGDVVPESVCNSACNIGEMSIRVQGQVECCFDCEPCSGNLVGDGVECTVCPSKTHANVNNTACDPNPITFLTWSNPWAILIVILTCIGIVATTFVIVVFLVHYKHELIKASSRELSAILLAGIFLCYILPFFYIARPSAAICAIRRFGIGFCFAVSFSALLVKTNRIHRIFNRSPNASAKNLRFISPTSQVFITFGFISIQVLIAVVWLAAEQPGVEAIIGDTQTELICNESPYIGLALSLGYNLFLLILSTYFAFLTRKVPQNFNEAVFINITMYTICVTWLAFVPTYFATVNLGTLFQTTSLAFGIILSASTTLCCLYISKVIILFRKKKKEAKSTTTIDANASWNGKNKSTDDSSNQSHSTSDNACKSTSDLLSNNFAR